MDDLLYNSRLKAVISSPPAGFKVINAGNCNSPGLHPFDYTDVECLYAAEELSKCTNAKRVIDAGSYRHFAWGLRAKYDVVFLDIRPFKYSLPGWKVIALDIRNISSLPFDFDVLISLCTMEHVGLGHYGDEYDIDGDKKAFIAISEVLKPGNSFIFTVPVTKVNSIILFNVQRVYNYELLCSYMPKTMQVVDEKFFKYGTFERISPDKLTDVLGNWDLYCGHWRKMT